LRVLHYNWVDYLDEENRGGGVTVYQLMVMRALAEDAWADATFLCSGLSYDLRGGPPRWEQIKHGPSENRANRYEIVNSGTQAPGHHSFGLSSQLDDADTLAVLFDFIDKTGPYDVIHFNNLEGLPATALTLKARWPDTKVILSLHNYYPICPQVNLWFQEREICDDFEGGAKCAVCLPEARDPRMLRLSGALAYRAKRLGIRPGSWLFDHGLRWGIRQGGRLLRLIRRKGRAPAAKAPVSRPLGNAAHFAQRRQTMIETINQNCDHVLCMSDAVRAVALRFGVSPDIARTSYIGTKEARSWHHTTPRTSLCDDDGTLRICFMGYMRRDKGFYFLLELLEALPEDHAARIHLVLAARKGDAATMARVDALRARLGGLTYHDGYTHDGLDDILHGVGVGIIPVLWHDNLPQVALEMHARHIALLTSDLGGAQELGNCPDMVFKAGDIAAASAAIARILDGAHKRTVEPRHG